MADQAQLEQQELFQGVLGDQPPQPAPEPQSQPPAQPTEPPAEPPQPGQPPKEAAEAAIPSWRLREESEARRAAEERARQLGERLQQIETHLRQGQKAPDFFENPENATNALIMKHLQPIAQETHRQMMYMGKLVADSIHGADKVSEAEQAFLEAMNAQTLDTADYERVVQSPNRYDEVVKWYNSQAILSEVGNDPNAWFEQQLEARMADPTFQAKVLEKMRSDASKRPSSTELPPSLSRVTAARSNAEPVGDMSDASLFAFATKP